MAAVSGSRVALVAELLTALSLTHVHTHTPPGVVAACSHSGDECHLGTAPARVAAAGIAAS